MTFSQAIRSRIIAAAVIATVIPVGLFARSQRAGADVGTFVGFLATYAGDMLWPIMFFFIGRFLFPYANRWKLFVSILLLTQVIEIGQLWQPGWLQWLRSQPIIGFVLGNTFLWSDVVCLLVGSVVALLIDCLLFSIPNEERTDSPPT